MTAPVPAGIGLVIVGSEILDGRRQDSHFPFCRDRLKERHLPLVYTLILPDIPRLLESQLAWCLARPEPFFCCGGIGGTPDDYTRACAARATGRELVPHPEGVAILDRRFGKDATPARMRMVTFPEGATLIPNPVNEVPGFSVGDAHFLPGFPEMARPMMTWVLDTYYPAGPERVARSLLLHGVREADLTEMMEQFMADHPAISFSSLPRYGPRGNELDFTVKGLTDAADAGFADLKRRLTEAGYAFEEPD